MVEYLSWIRPQHAQRKWDACNRQSEDQERARSIPACGMSHSRLSWPGPRSPAAVTTGRGVAASWGWPTRVFLYAPEAGPSPGEGCRQERC